VPRRLRPIARAALVALVAVVLTGCRLDVAVEVVMQPDGTGTVTVDAIADAELVARVPDLVDDLRLDDAEANGWVIEGPTEQANGSVQIRLTHDFRTATELASVLNSIGPPLNEMSAARNTEPAEDGGEGPTTNAINGTLQLPDGFASFADAELVTAVGGQPFGEQIAASGLTPDDAMSFVFRVNLPGELVTSETGSELPDGVIEWRAALDGTQTSLLTQTVQRPAGEASGWARPVATLSLVLLVAWVVAATAFIVFVVLARRKKRLRREQALRDLERRVPSGANQADA
jgi:hypothetical protein